MAKGTAKGKGKRRAFPRPGEVVIVKITKVMPYGAFAVFEDYPDIEGFLHIREVSSKWIKNIKEYIRQNQITVAKVIGVDKNKGIADISLRKVTEEERRRVWEAYENEKKARNVIKAAFKKLNREKEAEAFMKKVLDIYETLYDFALDVYDGELDVFDELGADKELRSILVEVIGRAFKPPPVTIKKIVELIVYESDGVEHIKKAFLKLEKEGIGVHYMGAPHYMISYTSEDRKEVVKKIVKAEKMLEKELKKVKKDLAVKDVE